MVADRQVLVSTSLPAEASGALPGGSIKLLSRLTPAVRLAAVHVAQGLSNKEIAAALGRAEPTVKHQISSAMRQLGVQSRCQLIVLLLRRVAS